MTRHLPRGRTGPIILGALVILMLVLAAISAQTGGSDFNEPPYPTYNVHSAGPGGTRALSLWLGSMGHETRTLQYQQFRIDPRTQLMFMLFPSLDPTDQQVTDILNWVDQGGTLVLASGYQTNLQTQLGLTVIQSAEVESDVVSVDPSWNDPPLTAVDVNTYASLQWRDSAWIPVLEERSTGKIVAASRNVGEGTILALTTGDPFSNSGLAQQGNRDLTLNVLARMPPSGTVIIDEYHHGFTEQGTFTYQLLRQPWGWAVLFVAAVIFAFIGLNGRRFGRTTQPYAQTPRRSRSEFAATLASMLHQNRQRDWLRERYVEQLKRSLGARFRVASNLATPEFVAQLAQRRPAAAALSKPLEQLELLLVPDERRLVDLIRETETIAARVNERPATTDTGDNRLQPNGRDTANEHSYSGKME